MILTVRSAKGRGKVPFELWHNDAFSARRIGRKKDVGAGGWHAPSCRGVGVTRCVGVGSQCVPRGSGDLRAKGGNDLGLDCKEPLVSPWTSFF